jgi:flagellar basal-body rod protein FlgB
MDIQLSSATEAALERGLDIAHQRHKLTASNIANLDTPGYKPRHLSFDETLARVEVAGAAPELELRQGDARHLGGGPLVGSPRVVTDETARRTDGNGVDPEREMSDLAQNGIHFAALAQTLSARYRKMRGAITEGK